MTLSNFCSVTRVGFFWEDSSGSAEAVEHEVEDDADEGIDERGYSEARGEPWLGVSEE